jgi:hypothetical protein
MSIHRLIPPSPSGRLRPLRTGAAITGLVAAALAPAATARAHTVAAGTTTCAGSQTVAFSPGLSGQRHRGVVLHGTTTLGRCASSADPTITGGRSTFKATGRLSCTSGDYSGTRKITWNNGRTSTMSFKSVISTSGGESVVATKGEVTDGEFSGHKWSATFTMLTARPPACATPAGLPTASGRLLLTIGSLVPGRSAPDRSRPSLR